MHQHSPMRFLTILTALSLTACSSGQDKSGVTKETVAPKPATFAADLPPSMCQVTANNGTMNGYFLIGNVLTSNSYLPQSNVSVGANGIINAIGAPAPTPGQTIIDCTGLTITAGMINAHDHLKYNQNYPGGQNVTPPSNPEYEYCNNANNAYNDLDCAQYRYDRRNEWRRGLNGKAKITTTSGTRDNRVLVWNELRQLIGGVTSITGSGGSAGLLRNIDYVGSDYDYTQGLNLPAGKLVKYDTFPLGDISDVAGHYENCNYPKLPSPSVISDNLIYLPHVSEGIDGFAENEYWCLTGENPGAVNLLAPQSTFIHSIAVNPPMVEEAAMNGMSFIWSPRSNISLYGNTAQVTLFRTLGLNIALATDWTPSGSMNMGRELACASAFNETYLNQAFSAMDLWHMVTVNGAQALSVANQLGELAVGYWADLVVSTPTPGATDAYAGVIGMTPASISLIMRGGLLEYGDSALLSQLDASCEPIPIPELGTKAACVSRETGYTMQDLMNANQESYPLYRSSIYDEPTCTPARFAAYGGDIVPDDQDGDGIDNTTDNCPAIFNPVRPMDNGQQADYDHDGLGDVCDPVPLGNAGQTPVNP